ncbi:hypothetical protein BCU68_09075 [Vibrio sp. 10N.286.49.B3]|uniref:capsular polysaccharide export protein, LipB/KpsS family n=1 Tax=Vibrio sp. 10N.286.49.B3 TaxID=1880855 RepID=UPI000C824605|nr:phosphoribosylamine--glycine ligase [Vibrio sp. 10N.286.49.B3]PMH45937.1 hypothetical protein BCU68_09075 [Vibrio sp. 10N.286.49.B3]
MKKDYTLLSLDPMYSPLHEHIADIVAKKKYAVTSCRSKRIYLPTFKMTLATSLINSVKAPVDEGLLNKITSLSTYHHAYAKKVEGRRLTASELNYMAKFYLGLKEFITTKGVNLVVLHNDTRWYHAIAVMLCKELEIQYLVTEQGLIRPNTTVIDNQGVNATANVGLLDKEVASSAPFRVKHGHDSRKSKAFFCLFLSLFFIEKKLASKGILSYMHNGYSIRKYLRRTLNIRYKQNFDDVEVNTKSVLLLLQLESDSQFLMYSSFFSNQDLIDKVEHFCTINNLNLLIKKHPLDDSGYQIKPSSNLVSGSVKQLAKEVKLVISINSSAIITVLSTATPLYIIGDSSYKYKNIATHSSISDISLLEKQDIALRKEYLNKLKKNYLVYGAGYSYKSELLENKLNQLLV